MSDQSVPLEGGFAAFALDERLHAAVAAGGYTDPTPVQAAAIPPLLEGRDVIGRARTGSGKTAAFSLPLLERVKDGGRRVRALVLTPTRELALQVARAVERYGAGLDLRVAALYGGAPYREQFEALSGGATVVVGTPGRILDHIDRGSLDLGQVDFAVLDEADEMLRMGFVDDVRTIFASLPLDRQTALFSATMPTPIREVAAEVLRDPIEIEVERRGPAADHIAQRFVRVPDRFKIDALLRFLRGEPAPSTLVFVRTRRAAAEIADALWEAGISVDALHGDLDQPTRERVIERLRQGRVEVVVATDVAARGLDVANLARVINYDMPDDTDTYVHRIGRTGRAGAEGAAISFVAPYEGRKVQALESALRTRFDPCSVPTDAAIARLRREALHADLAADPAPEALALAAAFIQEACERTGRSAEDVAAAALLRLVGPGALPLALPEDAPPAWARARRSEPRPDVRGRSPVPQTDDHVELFLPLGRRHGVRVGDLVGALTKGLGLQGADVGRIRLEERKSFVGVPREIAARWTRDSVEIVIRGTTVPVRLARGVTPEPGSSASRR